MTITRFKFILAQAFIFVLFLLPNLAFAHGGALLTITSTTSEGYIVDVDVQDGTLRAGEYTRMDVGLFRDSSRTKSVNFTNVAVRINEKAEGWRGKLFFSGLIAKTPFLGGTGFSFLFPKSGTYILGLRYDDVSSDASGKIIGGKTVVETEIELNVLPSSYEDKFNIGKEFWAGLIVGAFTLALLILPFFVKKKEE